MIKSNLWLSWEPSTLNSNAQFMCESEAWNLRGLRSPGRNTSIRQNNKCRAPWHLTGTSKENKMRDQAGGKGNGLVWSTSHTLLGEEERHTSGQKGLRGAHWTWDMRGLGMSLSQGATELGGRQGRDRVMKCGWLPRDNQRVSGWRLWPQPPSP